MASSAPRGLRSDHVVTVGIALFSMLFGAGNLIIPPLLALQAGSATPVAMIGFLIAAIGLPVMGFIAVALAGTARELAGRVHPKFGEFFVAAVYLAIGPCLAIPRTSSTAFEMLVPLLPEGVSLGTARLVFAIGFFVVAFVLTLRPGVITRVLGRITGPALIALIVLVVGAAVISPLGPAAAPQAPYNAGAAVQGFLTGYQTMDLLASLAFGIIIAETIHELGVTDDKRVAFEISRSGVIAGVLASLFMEGRVASPDTKALLHELSPIDSSEPELMDPLAADSTRIFDTVVAAYLLDSDRSEFDEAYLADTYLQMALPAARGAEGAGEDAPAPAARTAALTLALVAPLRECMARENAANVFDGIEMPLVPVLAKMERAGMLVDPDRLHSLSEGLATQITEVERSIRDLAGDETFNIGSPMQLSHVLFDVMGLPTKGLKKTKRGYYSTNAKVLSDLARDHEIVRLILDWREKSKIKSTYLDTLGPLRRGDGRVHTTYNQTITATGRLSSSDPNLQNIPTRSELGRTVKTAFSAGEGSVFLAVDYSQIELRLLAHLSGDEHLVRAFNEGEDFHAETAARVFGVPVSEVTPDLRSRAKAVNFGIVYGQQAYGLSQSLHISMAEARDMIDRYYEAYPGVRTFLDNVVARAKQTGYAETMYGRRRHIPELKAKNPQLRGFGERTAMNHPMQGTAADIIKIAMVRVSRRLEEEGFAAHMILQVHDELDFECPIDEVERLTAMVRDVMEHVVDLRVPLIAEASTGITWADAK